MTVRAATIDDAAHCARLGLKFIDAAGMPSATFGECLVFCESALSSDAVGAFVSDQGVILGVVAPLYYKPTHFQAIELFWWAEDGKGLALLKAFEKWAEDRGAHDINMSTLAHFTSEKIDRLLDIRGYELRDKTFRKELRK